MMHSKFIVKRGAAIAVSAALCLCSLPLSSLPVFAEETENLIECDISKGSVTIGNTAEINGNADAITYTDASGVLHEKVDISSASHIVITGSTTSNTIMVRDYDDAPLDITFKDLSIDVTQIPAEETGYVSTCAVYFGGESASFPEGRINLTLEGTNTIRSLDYAGIAVPLGETLSIDGEGSLTVESVRGNANVSAPAIGAPVSIGSAPDLITNEELDTNFGTIIINGGAINASSDDCGIGGGQSSLGGTVVINGGEVTAIANSSSASGIGCGQDGAIGAVIITGGIVNAQGSNAGSGIGGGGMHTDSGIIVITGGQITATGGNYGAGIGGGNTNNYGHGYATQINITGGEITAIGGFGAAGIGGGAPYGTVDNVSISGGIINAYGGEGKITNGVHKSRQRTETGMTMVEDGTSVTAYAPGAGIGNAGSYYSIVNYTSGNNAGKTVASGTVGFGGNISITGGTVHSYGGLLPEDGAEILANAGYEIVDAQGIGNGAYISEQTETTPYEEFERFISFADVYENDVQINSAAEARTNYCTQFGHTYGDWEVLTDASCQMPGISLRTCEVCGNKDTTYADKLAHTFGDWEVIRQPSCLETGLTMRVCAECGVSETEELAMISHTIVEDKAVAATVLKSGKTAGSHCSVCGEVIEAQKTVKKLTPTIKLSSTKKSLKVKKAFTLTISKLAKGDSIKSVKSNKNAVATVKKTAAGKYKITAKKAGKATVTVTLKSGKTAKCTITVKK